MTSAGMRALCLCLGLALVCGATLRERVDHAEALIPKVIRHDHKWNELFKEPPSKPLAIEPLWKDKEAEKLAAMQKANGKCPECSYRKKATTQSAALASSSAIRSTFDSSSRSGSAVSSAGSSPMGASSSRVSANGASLISNANPLVAQTASVSRSLSSVSDPLSAFESRSSVDSKAASAAEHQIALDNSYESADKEISSVPAQKPPTVKEIREGFRTSIHFNGNRKIGVFDFWNDKNKFGISDQTRDFPLAFDSMMSGLTALNPKYGLSNSLVSLAISGHYPDLGAHKQKNARLKAGRRARAVGCYLFYYLGRHRFHNYVLKVGIEKTGDFYQGKTLNEAAQARRVDVFEGHNKVMSSSMKVQTTWNSKTAAAFCAGKKNRKHWQGAEWHDRWLALGKVHGTKPDAKKPKSEGVPKMDAESSEQE